MLTIEAEGRYNPTLSKASKKIVFHNKPCVGESPVVDVEGDRNFVLEVVSHLSGKILHLPDDEEAADDRLVPR
jgi:hypothetical protein